MKSFRLDRRTAGRVIQWILIALAACFCLAMLTWANYRFAQSNPGGNDFLARWMGARFSLQGIQPYDDRVALETQRWIYGRPADPARGEDLSRFAYPLYAMIFFGPFGLFDFTTARAMWMTLLEVGTAAFAILTASIAGWESRRGKTALWIIAALLGYFGFRAIINGNPVVLVGVFLAGAVFLLGKGFPRWAGILLALATIKPQIVVFPILWMILWCIFQKRYSVIASFFLTLAVLIGACMLPVPDWIVLNLREILDYPAYTQPGNPAAVLAVWFGEPGRIAGWGISFLLLAGLAWIWLRNRRSSFETFLLVLGVTVAGSPLLGIPFDPGNEYLLLLPLAMALSVWGRPSWKDDVSWALALGAIFVGLWAVFLLTLQTGPQPVQNPVLLFPLPCLLLLWFAILRCAKPRADAGA